MGLWCRYFSYAQESRARIAQCVGPIEEAAGTSGGNKCLSRTPFVPRRKQHAVLARRAIAKSKW